MSLRRPNGFISAGFNPLEVPNAPTSWRIKYVGEDTKNANEHFTLSHQRIT